MQKAKEARRFDINSPREIQKERMRWRHGVPKVFPCMICRRERAEFRYSFGYKSMVVKVVLCGRCVELDVTVIAEEFVG